MNFFFFKHHISDFFTDHSRSEVLDPVHIGIGYGFGIDVKYAQSAFVFGGFHPVAVFIMFLESFFTGIRSSSKTEHKFSLHIQSSIVVISQFRS